MLKYLVDTVLRRYAKDLLSREITLESDAPIDPFEAHLACTLDQACPTKTQIPPNTAISGTLTSSRPVHIDGSFIGTLECTHLTIGKSGYVKSSFCIDSGTISGRVEGNIFVEEHLTIHTSAHITGNVTARSLTLEDGAIVTGSISIDTPTAREA